MLRRLRMKELYNIGICEKTLKSMMGVNPELSELSDKEIKEKEKILKDNNCSDNQVLNIISSNSLFLNRTNGEINKLICYLKETGFTCLNILFDSNPYILNLEVFEIKNYIDVRLNNGEELDDIVDDLDSNPLLFQEM